MYHPQLEVDPGTYKGGVKRFQLYKNEDSPALILGGSAVENSSKNLSSRNSSQSLGNSSRFQQNHSLSPIRFDLKKLRSPVKYIFNDPVNNKMLDLLSHPAFKVPKYTKNNPKVYSNNPIIGYPSSSNAKHMLSDNGSRILLQGKHKN